MGIIKVIRVDDLDAYIKNMKEQAPHNDHFVATSIAFAELIFRRQTVYSVDENSLTGDSPSNI